MSKIQNIILSKSKNGTSLASKKMNIVKILSQQKDAMTTQELARLLNISAPTCLKLLNQLIEDNIVKELGKKETEFGRKPSLYNLNEGYLSVASIEIGMKRISFAILDNNLKVHYQRHNPEFLLENTQECLNKVVSFIKESIKDSQLSTSQLLGIGVGITGRVKKIHGESLTYFNFLDTSFANFLSDVFRVPVFINNDTRCFGIAEKMIGKAAFVSNSIIINLGRGLGSSLIFNGVLFEGGSGFAGELGHMQWEHNDTVCICGKKGCLGNEVSGYALEEKFKERILKGEKSLVTSKVPKDRVRYDDIILSALEGDALSIELIHELGFKLGKALGNIINLLNPELIIIGGKFTQVKGIILDPIKIGMMSTALLNPLKICSIEFSDLGNTAILQGGGAMVFKHFEYLK